MRAVEITDDMIERAGRALCDLDNERELQAARKGLLGDVGETGVVGECYENWADEYNEQARVALEAALLS